MASDADKLQVQGPSRHSVAEGSGGQLPKIPHRPFNLSAKDHQDERKKGKRAKKVSGAGKKLKPNTHKRRVVEESELQEEDRIGDDWNAVIQRRGAAKPKAPLQVPTPTATPAESRDPSMSVPPNTPPAGRDYFSYEYMDCDRMNHKLPSTAGNHCSKPLSKYRRCQALHGFRFRDCKAVP
ncbi:hypothetical protein CPB83DRAFT_896713 [Crepidotus variabilis]|uniref:Uncharacterized protein n=1 Tax=Crepidotus variabilis TaxID=179855 RepID=A0A9P6EB55_9AGAR|nr:hypothetical protein CPB83DRAFT_896713 [Crepidotus variabilis]